jgi:hypothetical protein
MSSYLEILCNAALLASIALTTVLTDSCTTALLAYGAPTTVLAYL